MTAFVLVPGAGGMAWYWHRAVPLIRAAGHEPIAVDLPGDDRHAGLGKDLHPVRGIPAARITIGTHLALIDRRAPGAIG